MDKVTFLLSYLIVLTVCLALTVGLIFSLNKGLKKFFENLTQDPDIAKFFIKLTNLILFLAGFGAALKNAYDTGEKANWLTLIWDIAGHLENSLENLFITLIVFAVTFFILHLIAKRVNK
jgi:hypothetical protein